ncbi:MAG: prolipoprotein diacylglyceryl transferase [Sporichthyaceae bacterium]
MLLASIPSPSQGVWHIGDFPLRGYALAIVAGIVVAIVVGDRRLRARGGAAGMIPDIAFWAVPFGIVGGRIYHVLTTPEPYFGSGGDPVEALMIWKGGLGIWGAIAFGGLGAYIGARRLGILCPVVADAVAPGIALAQALGRWGNWFNQELYGKPTDLPWALEIDAAHRPAATPEIGTYHPTFLYESLWCVGVALLVIWADRRFELGHGQAFWLYVATYCVGRLWIEALRVDTAEEFFGLRLNIFTSLVLFAGAVAYIVYSRRRFSSREPSVYREGNAPGTVSAVR